MKSIILPGMALIAVCYAFARFAFGLFLPSISEEFGLDGSSSGIIQSVSYARINSGTRPIRCGSVFVLDCDRRGRSFAVFLIFALIASAALTALPRLADER